MVYDYLPDVLYRPPLSREQEGLCYEGIKMPVNILQVSKSLHDEVKPRLNQQLCLGPIVVLCLPCVNIRVLDPLGYARSIASLIEDGRQLDSRAQLNQVGEPYIWPDFDKWTLRTPIVAFKRRVHATSTRNGFPEAVVNASALQDFLRTSLLKARRNDNCEIIFRHFLEDVVSVSLNSIEPDNVRNHINLVHDPSGARHHLSCLVTILAPVTSPSRIRPMFEDSGKWKWNIEAPTEAEVKLLNELT